MQVGDGNSDLCDNGCPDVNILAGRLDRDDQGRIQGSFPEGRQRSGGVAAYAAVAAGELAEQVTRKYCACTRWLVRFVRFLSSDRWFDRFGYEESIDLVELV